MNSEGVGRDERRDPQKPPAGARRRSSPATPTPLRALHHPGFRFTTPRGDVRDRDAYIAGNTEGDLVWREQHLVEHDVVVAGDTAVLTGVVHDVFERAGEPGSHDMLHHARLGAARRRLGRARRPRRPTVRARCRQKHE